MPDFNASRVASASALTCSAIDCDRPALIRMMVTWGTNSSRTVASDYCSRCVPDHDTVAVLRLCLIRLSPSPLDVPSVRFAVVSAS